MKIIIDGRLLLPQMTGIGRYLMGLAQGLRDIGGKDHFELWLQKNLPDNHPVWEIKGDNLTLKRLDLNHMVIDAHWRIPRALRSSSCDLFHYPHFDLPILTQGAVVATIHDLKYLAYPKFFPHFRWGKRFLMWMMMYYTVHRAAQVITVSASTKNDLVQHLHVQPEKVAVIPEGVDERFRTSYPDTFIAEILARYQLRKPFFFFVGERRPHKNIESAIKAFQLFTQEFGDQYQFIISGKQYSDYDEPEKWVDKLGLNNLVHFVYISDFDLPMVYQAAEVFITLSLYEGFGLPVVEAMASGTPVIAANATSLPEIVGDAGILVDPRDVEATAAAMVSLIQNERLRESLIKSGIERSDQYRWENCAQKTLEIYDRAKSLS